MEGELLFNDSLFKSIEVSVNGHGRKGRYGKKEEMIIDRRGIGFKPSGGDEEGKDLKTRVKESRALSSITAPNQSKKRTRGVQSGLTSSSLRDTKKQRQGWQDKKEEEEESKASLVSQETQAFSILLPKLQMASQKKKKGKKKKKKKKGSDIEEEVVESK